MKKLLLSVAALAAVMGTGAQTAAAQENSNQTSIRVAGWEVLLDGRVSTPHVPEYKTSRYYGGRIGTFEIGFNGLREPSGAYALYPADESGFMDPRVGKSIHLTFNVFTFSASLARNNVVGITAGMGFTIADFLEAAKRLVQTFVRFQFQSNQFSHPPSGHEHLRDPFSGGAGVQPLAAVLLLGGWLHRSGDGCPHEVEIAQG